jgi:hypothetical protein
MTKTHYHVDPGFDDAGYGLIDLGIQPPHLTAERFLFLWVILRALMDIGMIGEHGNARNRKLDTHEYHHARHWLLHDKRDFFLTCEMAGASPCAIRGAVQKFVGERQRVVQ